MSPSLHIVPPRPHDISNDLATSSYTHPHPHAHPQPIAPRNQSPRRPSNGGSSSPVAPAYSPITPKARPALPVNVDSNNAAPPAFVPPENGGNFTFTAPNSNAQTQQQQTRPKPVQKEQPVKAPAAATVPPAEYIPQPPNLPFSSKDATDAVALRAAISTLQFQKQKAQDDIHVLEKVKQLALDDPEHFKEELAAGRLKEQRPKIGDLQAILDAAEDGDSDDEVVLGAPADGQYTTRAMASKSLSPEIPDSQPASQKPLSDSQAQHFPRIPGPQNVVRMPHINWNKYGISGEPLETMHEQQKKWPGSAQGYGVSRGREYAVAAPYSPFHDQMDAYPKNGERKDSGPRPSATGTISEHIMETRSRN
ncbi:hypothetical protein HII31_03098 [Pseudocercospora fuligena]|uniref:Uncharacterized protein n=1 Tax=Pseudocercospora fuligena TaxID=685502 RepID=A0A8H6RQ71_9PEZI|nr:hypothetical protein HII31_03098 [Pseudocercospora fuligena]